MSGPRRGAAAPRLLVALTLRLSGARVVQVGPGRVDLPAGSYHGVVVTGGHDVEPVLYARESEVLPRYDRERDEFESALIDEALSNGIPMLGICRGAQLLNVRLGGDLHQDLRSHRHHTSHRRTLLPLKAISICESSQLAALIGATDIRVNSLHQQAIDRLGEGLSVSARDRDQIVQGVEHKDFDFLIGTQWHPEFLVFRRADRNLFAGLVDAARRRCQAESES
ncbi:MAG: gamma-glutamyl-gamma-aminobutyrate hydrolase family protein [Pseudomonadales bacterium]|nr:gamma-glutamyl-gamma-aminobutyrate hydrolase family protein [Pseudomonadales bacterium]